MNKAEKLIRDDRIFKVSESKEKEYYIVKGKKDTYEVIYDKRLDTYICNCNNIRLTPCYHIKGVKLLKSKRGERDERK